MKKILVIEDCLQTQQILGKILQQSEAEVQCVATAADARQALSRGTPDMILLDLSLPDGDGFQLFSELRGEAATADVPVIFITGKQEVAVKVAAFSLGAEDYIVKPFDLVELKARLHAKVKKLHRDQAKSSSMIFGLLQIDLSRQLVFDLSDNKRAIPFTSREFKLLVFLARNENNVLSREQLLDAVWGNASSVFDRTVDTHISAIRKKLGNLAGYIDSVKGSGYRFCGPAQIRKSA